jgi:hypothetical protein
MHYLHQLPRSIHYTRLGFYGCHGSVEFTIAWKYQAISLRRGYMSELWLFHDLPIENGGGYTSPPLRNSDRAVTKGFLVPKYFMV